MRLATIFAIGLSFALGAAAPADAHHSFSMFDRSKSVTVSGTVMEFDWVNPHSWIQLAVAGRQGQTDAWSIELGGPGQLNRMGLDRDSFKPGDKITVTLYPLRDGSFGGQFQSVVLPNGKTVTGRFPGAPGEP